MILEFIKEENRIYSKNSEGNIIAEIDFPEIETGIFNISHTFVDESLRGQGIAKKLVEMAIEEIERKNGKVVATCSYAKNYIEKIGDKINGNNTCK